MTRETILARWRRLWQNLNLDGRLRLTRRWMLLPGPLALLLALVVAYRDLFFVAYAYLLLVAVAYLWVREVGPRVRLRRRIRSEWAQVGDELEEQWELTNKARLPLLWLEIEDASTLPGYTGRRVAAGGAGVRAGRWCCWSPRGLSRRSRSKRGWRPQASRRTPSKSGRRCRCSTRRSRA
jgi:hypothetical protein